jgi:hypothetical protein
MKRILVAAVATTILAGGAAFTAAPARGTVVPESPGPSVQHKVAASNPQGEMVLEWEHLGLTWCITPTGAGVGDEVVLGKCANANTQQWTDYNDGSLTSGYFELDNNWSGLCLTYPNSDGHADGVIGVLGHCIDDKTQVFELGMSYYGGLDNAWPMPYDEDNNYHLLAIDDQEGRLKAYNPIDSSYWDTNIPQEDWTLYG